MPLFLADVCLNFVGSRNKVYHGSVLYMSLEPESLCREYIYVSMKANEKCEY